jgi:hypothetical protein
LSEVFWLWNEVVVGSFEDKLHLRGNRDALLHFGESCGHGAHPVVNVQQISECSRVRFAILSSLAKEMG